MFQGSWSTSRWSSSPCCSRQYCTPVSQVWATTGQAPPPAWQKAPPLPTKPRPSLENTLPILLHGGGCYIWGWGFWYAPPPPLMNVIKTILCILFRLVLLFLSIYYQTELNVCWSTLFQMKMHKKRSGFHTLQSNCDMWRVITDRFGFYFILSVRFLLGAERDG